MDTASIQEYVESAQSVIENSPQMQEATTKASLLNDFIELLDWKIPMNTELEYSVKAFGKTHKVDYALLLGGQPSAFLEAKGLDSQLTSSHRKQLADYLNGENVTWGILTNGEEYEFYQRRFINDETTVDQVEKTTLQQLPSKCKVIQAYQTEKIRDKKSKEIIEYIRQLRKSRRTLTNKKDELATTITSTLTNSVSEAIESEAETEAKEMIDRLVEDIESEINIDIDTDTDGTDQSKEEDSLTGSKPESDPEIDTSPVTKAYRVDISYNDDNKTFKRSVQSDLMASVVDYLIQNHDLISTVEPLPYIPGRKRAIINDEAVHDGNQMKSPQEVEQGHYLELNLSWDQKKREMRRMAEACGVDISIQ